MRFRLLKRYACIWPVSLFWLTLKSRWRTWAARFSRNGCEYQAVVVAEPVMKKNLLRLFALRIGDQAVPLHITYL